MSAIRFGQNIESKLGKFQQKIGKKNQINHSNIKQVLKSLSVNFRLTVQLSSVVMQGKPNCVTITDDFIYLY